MTRYPLFARCTQLKVPQKGVNFILQAIQNRNPFPFTLSHLSLSPRIAKPLKSNYLLLLWQKAQNPQGNLCEAFSSPSATSAVEYSPYRQSLFTRQGLMEDEKRRGRISQAV